MNRSHIILVTVIVIFCAIVSYGIYEAMSREDETYKLELIDNCNLTVYDSHRITQDNWIRNDSDYSIRIEIYDCHSDSGLFSSGTYTEVISGERLLNQNDKLEFRRLHKFIIYNAITNKRLGIFYER